VRRAARETWLGPEHFILPLFIHEEGATNQPIPSMPGIERLRFGKNVVDHVAEARSYGVNQIVIFPKVCEIIGTLVEKERNDRRSAIRVSCGST